MAIQIFTAQTDICNMCANMNFLNDNFCKALFLFHIEVIIE